MDFFDALTWLLFDPDTGTKERDSRAREQPEPAKRKYRTVLDRFGRPMLTTEELEDMRVEFRKSLARTDY